MDHTSLFRAGQDDDGAGPSANETDLLHVVEAAQRFRAMWEEVYLGHFGCPHDQAPDVLTEAADRWGVQIDGRLKPQMVRDMCGGYLE